MDNRKLTQNPPVSMSQVISDHPIIL
jgi:hypothetical protein